jgi:hypothetical protein
MSNQQLPKDWRVLADRFIWSDGHALALIPEEISDEEIQKYLYVFHNDPISIKEIQEWRTQQEQGH